MTDLDIIHKAIIESKGCKGDDFPYEYYCPDDFSVTINPEDWTTDHGDTVAQKQIPTQVTIPEGYDLKVGTCNGEDWSTPSYYFNVYVSLISEEELNLSVSLDIESNVINISVVEVIDPSEVGSITLNFKDLIFLGNKK